MFYWLEEIVLYDMEDNITLKISQLSSKETTYFKTRLDIYKSTRSNNISPKYLQLAAPVIGHVLTQIFNLSISKSEFPSPFKIASHPNTQTTTKH